jgi:ubiquinone/menaquinone biosynthesis C-methylase UbiE
MDEATRQRKERGIWDRQAAGYDGRTLRIYRDAYALSIEKARSVLAADNEVLEIGCGTGIISLGIAPYVARVVATDISPEMIAIAQDKAARAAVSNVEFQVCDGYSTPYDDGVFDAVLVFNTLHVVKEPAALLQEAHRLLKPGGYLVTATDCYGEPVPLPVRLVLDAQRLLKLFGVIPFMRYYEKENLRRLFEAHGTVIEDSAVLHPAPVNYYLLARKV